MPIIPTTVERLLFFQLNQAPGPLLDLFGAVAFRIVLSAIRLGVFDTLTAGPISAGELARILDADERGITILLDTLVALGYVSQASGRYANTAMTAKWLVRGSSSSIAAGFDYWGTLLAERWSDLEDTLRRGHPAENLYAWIEHQPTVSHDFQAWMIAAARQLADEVLAKISLPAGARRVLDIGGGHGIYSIALCRHYPALAATVLDSPMALQTARATIAAEQMAGQVGVQEGDFLHDNLGTSYDVALLFNIVHGFTSEQNTALLCKVAQALNPGGLVVIAEQVAGKSPGAVAPAIAQILGISYFQLLGGRIYTYEEIAGWLTAAGFSKLGRKNLRKAPGNSLVMGYKAG